MNSASTTDQGVVHLRHASPRARTPRRSPDGTARVRSLIENNYLEASGENFMLGGATPGDQWPGAIGSRVPAQSRRRDPNRGAQRHGTVKNLFELKNARRVLVEGNLFETHWAGAQPGYAIELTPRGERGAAPWAVVEDVTFHTTSSATWRRCSTSSRETMPARAALCGACESPTTSFMPSTAPRGAATVPSCRSDKGPADILVEHNTVVQTGNIISAYGGTREAPQCRRPFRVPRQHRAAQRQRGDRPEPRDRHRHASTHSSRPRSSRRTSSAGRPRIAVSRRQSVPRARVASRSSSSTTAGHDYRLRSDSELRRAATDGADLGPQLRRDWSERHRRARARVAGTAALPHP